MLQPILLVIIPGLEIREGFLKIFVCSNTAWIVCCYGGTLEALAEDFVASSDAGGVEGHGEDAALDLGRWGLDEW